MLGKLTTTIVIVYKLGNVQEQGNVKLYMNVRKGITIDDSICWYYVPRIDCFFQ